MIMNVEVQRDAKTKILCYFVNCYPFEPKNVSEHSNMQQNACEGGTYVSALQWGVHAADFES